MWHDSHLACSEEASNFHKALVETSHQEIDNFTQFLLRLNGGKKPETFSRIISIVTQAVTTASSFKPFSDLDTATDF